MKMNNKKADSNARKDRILAAADILFQEEGMTAITFSRIAFKADVPVSNIYYFYKFKVPLLTEMSHVRLAQLEKFLLCLKAKHLSPKEDLNEILNMLLKNDIPNKEYFQPSLFYSDRFFKEYTSLGKYICYALLETQKGEYKDYYEAFEPMIDLLFNYIEDKFFKLNNPIANPKVLTYSFISMVCGSYAVILNNQFCDLKQESEVFYYKKLVQKAFDL